MEREILILAITKAGPFQHCVGGIDVNTLASVRLRISEESPFLPADRFGFNISDIWRVRNEPAVQLRLRPPHLEDILIRHDYASLVGKVDSLHEWILTNCPHRVSTNGSIVELFNKRLRYEPGSLGYHKFFVDQVEDLDYSTCFWTTSAPLFGHVHYGKTYFRLVSTRSPEIEASIVYVGTANVRHLSTIEPGSLLRMSLARWLKPRYKASERCYLQISGVIG